MISFKTITEVTKDEVLRQFENLSNDEYNCVFDVINELSFELCDVEYAVSIFCGCLLIRIFDMGRYVFLYPYEISDNANLIYAIEAISEYAAREEIQLVFSDVPGEEISVFSGFRHMDVDAEDNEARSYRVKIKTECQLVDEIPEVTMGRVTLNAIAESDIGDYARLCKDENVNKYWGYDYSEDVASPKDAYFFEVAEQELARGVSMSMAIRSDGVFCGEAALYAFDGRGGAEFAIRLLPEFHGRGLGAESVLAAVAVARKIGLTTIHSKAFPENLPSVAMLKKVADECVEEDGILKFTIYLN